MNVRVDHSYRIPKTTRVKQVAGMMDLPLDEKLARVWEADLPLDETDWNVGLITGPSGSGKSAMARQIWGEELLAEPVWPKGKALVDGFPKALGIKDIVGSLSAVGLNSVPAWVKPYELLSTGEQFRAGLARKIAEHPDLAVIDEFTSVVDRQVAKVASHALQKAVRRAGGRVVAVTCHDDVIPWLQPDWLFTPADCSFQVREVGRRPPFRLDIHRVGRDAWRLFSHHHYLSGSLHAGAQCFGGYTTDGRLIAFASYRRLPHATARNIMIGHRGVVLPDYQGLGILGHMDDWLGEYYAQRGQRARNVVSHPASVRSFLRSPRWRCATRPSDAKLRHGRNAYASMARAQLQSRRLATWSFEYVRPS